MAPSGFFCSLSSYEMSVGQFPTLRAQLPASGLMEEGQSRSQLCHMQAKLPCQQCPGSRVSVHRHQSLAGLEHSRTDPLGQHYYTQADWNICQLLTVDEIKRCLLLGRKVMTNVDSILKSRDITLPTKVRLIKAMFFPVVVYGCESWTVKKAEC